ncbi:hypothetical protein SKAU_G00277200 [Synaphobranchus kaupii]|uniref:Pyrin domain-containing protein n=1 Tax=Synaphobranchus kaupii TaxID=118154 RepID=A0A9Q1F1H5_SYNKA|nr:hypothetical protein SKAU_G00277200 [Synaphobranchus kaupii]
MFSGEPETNDGTLNPARKRIQRSLVSDRLEETSSEKLSCPKQVSLIAAQVLKILKKLTKAELENFIVYLNDEERVLEECKPILFELADKNVTDVVILMKNAYGDKMVKLTLEILKKIDRNDLVQRWESNPKNREQASTDLGSASLHSSITAQTGASTMDHRVQTPPDLGSASLHSSVTAQTGGSAVVPQLHGCNVGGHVNITVNNQSDNKGEPAPTDNKGKEGVVILLNNALHIILSLHNPHYNTIL